MTTAPSATARTVLVTGGSRGIGAATARALHRDGAASVWSAALDAAGHVDVLVNNAGAWIASPIENGDQWHADLSANLALNLAAPAELCRLALDHFRRRDGGIIVNVASRSSHRGDDAEHLAYGAAKGGLLALTKGIGRGCARDGVLA